MLASQKTMDTLKGIGLNLYERNIWVALLARGTSTAGELSEISKVPRSRTYDILQSLAEKGFVIIQSGKPLRFVAVKPEEAFERAKKILEEKFRAMVRRLDEIKKSDVMKELNRLYSKGVKLISPEEMTGALKGKSSLLRQIDSMLKEAKEEVNILTTPEGLNELLSYNFENLRRAKERGVKIRIASQLNESCISAVEALSGIAEIRELNKKEVPINGRFLIVDGREMLLSLTDAKTHTTQDTALWSKSQYAAGNMLKPMFKLVWEHSKPLK